MNSSDPVSVLLPNAVAANAQADPDGIFAQVPKGTRYTDGFMNVTKSAFNNAINYTAAHIQAELGKSTTFETLAYIGPGDFRYSIMAVASMKVGYKVFFPSPRNSLEAQLALLNKLECTKLVMTEPQSPGLPSILQKLPLKTMVLPPLQQLLSVDQIEDVPYNWSFQEARHHPAFVLHTSGSTGIPKPMIFTNDWIAKVIAASILSPPADHTGVESYFKTGRFFMTLPSFHVAGLAFSLIIAAYHGSIPVYTLPGPPPNAESLVDAITSTEVDWAFVPPVVIDEFSRRADLLDVLASKLRYLFFTGGSVPKSAGDVVARRIPIWQVLGSSECGSIPLVHHASTHSNPQDWDCLQLNPSLGFEMRLRLDDLYELVFTRNKDTEDFQPVFAHFVDATEYETRDLFTQHPTQPDLWAYHSRIDDVIVFLNGEKTNPVTFEEEVIAHPEVKAALVIGAQRLEAALLVELISTQQVSDEEYSAIVDRIWPIVDKANRATPAHARVSKDKILLAHPDRPMVRAGKGTVQRGATLAAYAEDIEKLYQQTAGHDLSGGKSCSAGNDVKATIRNIIAEVLPLDDIDFFQLGLDSLMALKIQRALKSHTADSSLSLNAIYSNPTINGLAQLLCPGLMANSQPPSQDIVSVDSLLEKFQTEVRAIEPVQSPSPPVEKNEVTVLLTGSTGALGSYLLNELLSQPRVRHIYCFNRSSDAKSRQSKNHKDRELRSEFPEEKVTFLSGRLVAANFALPIGLYERLRSEVTHILHNAWPVNFNLPLNSFVESIAGVVNLARFLAKSQRSASLLFCSSISSATSSSGSAVPETVITDSNAPAAMGYGQSKHLAERLLGYATEILGVHTSSARIGQLAGAAKTASGWNRSEWFPSLIASSVSMGVIPDSLGGSGSINWVPIDQVAAVLVELLFSPISEEREKQPGSTVFNVVHPKPLQWSAILPRIKGTLDASIEPEQRIAIAGYAEWLSRLRQKNAEGEESGASGALSLAEKLPAVKLIDFYESLQQAGTGGLGTSFAMDATLKMSKTLRDLESLQDEWFDGWIKEWLAL